MPVAVRKAGTPAHEHARCEECRRLITSLRVVRPWESLLMYKLLKKIIGREYFLTRTIRNFEPEKGSFLSVNFGLTSQIASKRRRDVKIRKLHA